MGRTGPRSTPAPTAEGGQTKEACHSTKRTHRFFGGKPHLSISDTMGYTIKYCGKTLGSFSKTNPPVRGFGGLEGRFCRKLPRNNLHHEDTKSTKMNGGIWF